MNTQIYSHGDSALVSLISRMHVRDWMHNQIDRFYHFLFTPIQSNGVEIKGSRFHADFTYHPQIPMRKCGQSIPHTPSSRRSGNPQLKRQFGSWTPNFPPAIDIAFTTLTSNEKLKHNHDQSPRQRPPLLNPHYYFPNSICIRRTYYTCGSGPYRRCSIEDAHSGIERSHPYTVPGLEGGG